MIAKKLKAYLKYLTLTATEDTSECNHMCSSNCRKEGCNCECGNYHEPSKPKMEFIGTKKEWQDAKAEGNELPEHDCKASSEDGCDVCYKFGNAI